jgi:hypothetical protein
LISHDLPPASRRPVSVGVVIRDIRGAGADARIFCW